MCAHMLDTNTHPKSQQYDNLLYLLCFSGFKAIRALHQFTQETQTVLHSASSGHLWTDHSGSLADINVPHETKF